MLDIIYIYIYIHACILDIRNSYRYWILDIDMDRDGNIDLENGDGTMQKFWEF
jgi:hypothetical protein